jgi:hypothetical protein
MKHKRLTITFISLALGLGFNWLFFDKTLGLSVVIYTLLILGCMFYLAKEYKNPLNRSVYWLAPVAVFFASMVFVRANQFLAFINVCLVTYFLLLVARLNSRPTTPLSQYGFSQYANAVGSTSIRIMREACRFMIWPVTNRKMMVPRSRYTPVIRGILLSLPILFVFLLLLSSADLVFNKYVSALFDFPFTFSVAPETVFRWGFIGLVTSLFMGAYAMIFMPSSPPDAETAPTKRQLALGVTESSIILGSVGLLFLAFVIVQLTYLFGGSAQIVSTGFTYAEYARKGFFELIAVAVISLVFILVLKKMTRAHTAHHARIFTWLGGLLIAEVLVIMASAHMRLNLYEVAYGFTTLRLWSHLFILWLVVAFGLLLASIIRRKNEKRFAFHLCISIICFFAVINTINPDAFIARQNINRFYKTGKLDTTYLGTLSEDAVPVIAELLDSPKKDVQKNAAAILRNHQNTYSSHSTGWQSFNLAKQRADSIYRDKTKEIEAENIY